MSEWPWPRPADDGACRHIRNGRAVPAVRLPATIGGEVDLASLPGRSIVFCYPWTGAPGRPNPPGWDEIPGAHGSTPQAAEFAKLNSAFGNVRTRVFGLSLQPAHEQAEFAARMKLPFPLLSDTAGTFSRALGLPTFEAGGTTYLKRVTLAIANGRIERAVYPVHPPDTNGREMLAWCGAHPIGRALASDGKTALKPA